MFLRRHQHPSSAASTPSDRSTQSSPTAQDPNTGLLSGTQLKSLLLPAAVLPKGYSADPQATRDSGEIFAPPSSTAVDLATACPKLEASAWIQTSGISGAAFAQGDFTNPYHEEFNEEIDSFRGTDAQTVMTHLKEILTHCAHFTDTSSGTTASVGISTTTVLGVGDQTLKAVLCAPQWDGGTTLVATRVGNTVITTFYNTQSSDMGAAGLSLTKKIAAKVKAVPTG
ncbi:hypothetical protein ABZ746_28420 [Streptomyces sp. NPDC020096]